VAKTGFDNGIIILRKIVKSFAPSILADSSKASGISLKKLIKINKLKKLNAAGIM